MSIIVTKVIFSTLYGWDYNDAMVWLLAHDFMPTAPCVVDGRFIRFKVAYNMDFNPFLYVGDETGIDFILESARDADPFTQSKNKCGCCSIM